MVQEAVADQLKNLEEKLHEYKIRHKADEEAVEDEIAALEDTLAEVKVRKRIVHAIVHLDLSCFILVLQKRHEERVTCVIHFASTQHF